MRLKWPLASILKKTTELQLTYNEKDRNTLLVLKLYFNAEICPKNITLKTKQN